VEAADCGGTPCGEDGTCSVSTGCRGFAAKALCGEGEDDGRRYCDLHVERDFWSMVTCRRYCIQQGASCLEGWRDGEQACNKAQAHGCWILQQTQICRCTAR